MYVNEGQRPFVINLERNQKITKAEARKQNRKYYKEVGLPSKLNKRCPICSRHGACEHVTERKQFNPHMKKVIKNNPVLLIEWSTCTSCNAQVRKDATFCHSCGHYDPLKPRKKEELNK